MSTFATFELVPRDPDYPECLLGFATPPERLYGIGDPRLLRLGLGIIGARKATPYGLTAATRFAGWAAGQGIVVVSGAAIGCDQAAHKAALETGGATVAVLGCGADIDYPREAHGLLARIRSDGCVVSTFPWGMQPTRWTFLHRNHIIAGLSQALLVVEASVPSGTFTTADFALQEGRDVLAVPGSIFAPECRGSNRLIRQGARPVTDVSDLAMELGIASGVTATVAAKEPRETDDVLRALLADPMRPDDIAYHFALDIITVSVRLGEYEKRGLIARYPDGRYGPGERRPR